MNATNQTQRIQTELMISPVHQQRQRSTSKPQANKHSTPKKPNQTTEHLTKKQQRAKETSKFKIPET